MSEGTTTIMTAPSTAHSSPVTPSATAAQRVRERPPMSARPGARPGGRRRADQATEATGGTPSTQAAAARRARDGGAQRSSPAGGQRFYAPWPAPAALGARIRAAPRRGRGLWCGGWGWAGRGSDAGRGRGAGHAPSGHAPDRLGSSRGAPASCPRVVVAPGAPSLLPLLPPLPPRPLLLPSLSLLTFSGNGPPAREHRALRWSPSHRHFPEPAPHAHAQPHCPYTRPTGELTPASEPLCTLSSESCP